MKERIRIVDILTAFEQGLIDEKQAENKLFDLCVVVKSLPCKKCKDLEVIIKNGLDAKDLDNDCT